MIFRDLLTSTSCWEREREVPSSMSVHANGFSSSFGGKKLRHPLAKLQVEEVDSLRVGTGINTASGAVTCLPLHRLCMRNLGNTDVQNLKQK